MYIAFEKIELDVKLAESIGLNLIYSPWLYHTAEIPDKNFSKIPKNLEAIIISEELLKGSKFSDLNLKYKPTAKYRVGSRAFEDVKHTFAPESIPDLGVKVEYKVSEEDEKHSVAYMKVVMLDYLRKNFNFLDRHTFLELLHKRRHIRSLIDKCKTNADCHVVMHKYFGRPAHSNHILDDNLGDATFDLSIPGMSNYMFRDFKVDPGPTKENIDPSVFGLDIQLISEEYGTLESDK